MWGGSGSTHSSVGVGMQGNPPQGEGRPCSGSDGCALGAGVGYHTRPGWGLVWMGVAAPAVVWVWECRATHLRVRVGPVVVVKVCARGGCGSPHSPRVGRGGLVAPTIMCLWVYGPTHGGRAVVVHQARVGG